MILGRFLSPNPTWYREVLVQYVVWNSDTTHDSFWKRNGLKMIHTTESGSIHFLVSHSRPEPIRDADCEVMLPLTFDEVASLLIRPRAWARPCFMSWQDSNTNIRSWHRTSLSEGEMAERRVGAGDQRASGGSGDDSMTDTAHVDKHKNSYGMAVHIHTSTHARTQWNINIRHQIWHEI